MKKRVYYFNDKAGKAGHFETRRKGSNFDWRITTEEAARLLFVHGDNLPFDIMAKNYGMNDEDDKAWSGLCKDDLSEETADALAPLTLDEDWGPFEIWGRVGREDFPEDGGVSANSKYEDQAQKVSGLPYTTEKLEDGVISYDCKYCGNSYLEPENAVRHYRDEHLPGFVKMSAWLAKLPAAEFAALWTSFVMRRIPKNEKPEDYFERVRQRDLFAVEAKRRGL